MFLTVELSEIARGDSGMFATELDWARTVTVKPTSGRKVPPVGVDSQPASFQPDTFMFEVPADTASVTVRIDPTGNFDLGGPFQPDREFTTTIELP